MKPFEKSEDGESDGESDVVVVYPKSRHFRIQRNNVWNQIFAYSRYGRFQIVNDDYMKDSYLFTRQSDSQINKQ